MEFTAFLNYLEYEKRYSKHTLEAYKRDLEQFEFFLAANYAVDDWALIKSLHLRSWVVALMQKKLTASSIHRKISSLKTYHKFLRSRNAIPVMAFPEVLLPKKGERLPAYVEAEHIERLFPSGEESNTIVFPDGFVGLRDYLLLEILYTTGIRRSELIALKWEAINFEGNQMKVIGKGNKMRLIPFGEALKQTLAAYKKVVEEHFEHTLENVLVTDKGRVMYPKFVYNKVNHYLSLITTAAKRSPHVLRHSFATHLSNNGADLNAIKELLGHANLAATQVYTHNSIEQLRKVYEQAHPKAKKENKK